MFHEFTHVRCQARSAGAVGPLDGVRVSEDTIGARLCRLIVDRCDYPLESLADGRVDQIVGLRLAELFDFIVWQGDGADKLAEALSFGFAQIPRKHQGDRKITAEGEGIGDELALRGGLVDRQHCGGIRVDFGRVLATGGYLADTDLIFEPAQTRLSALAADGELGAAAFAELLEQVDDGTSVHGAASCFQTLLKRIHGGFA